MHNSSIPYILSLSLSLSLSIVVEPFIVVMDEFDDQQEAPQPVPPSPSSNYLPTPSYLFPPSHFPTSSSSSSSNTTQLLITPDNNIDWASLLSSTNKPSTTPRISHDHHHQKLNNNSDVDHVSWVAAGNNIEKGMVSTDRGVKAECEDKRKDIRLRKATSPRFEFQTRSSEDILDDGYRWRKYGQKAVKNSVYPRSYYRCTHLTCNVKKQVQRQSEDAGVVVTTYQGVHNHPSEKLMETLTPLLHQLQFLSRTA
ncbi:WRKY Transcription Factor [Ancistrocladus abbreviatus]